jgi:hypothetical protein
MSEGCFLEFNSGAVANDCGAGRMLWVNANEGLRRGHLGRMTHDDGFVDKLYVARFVTAKT